MSLLQRFTENIRKAQLFNSGDGLLLAVSGGLDSVVLGSLCKEAGYHFAIAHCNFGLRGAESDGDAELVKALAEKWNVPFFVNTFDTTSYAALNKVSIQVAARDLRYRWFETLLQDDKRYTRLVTAHHADDAVETALMHFCKGTGIGGLKGLPQRRGFIVRPLLFAFKEELIAYATEKELEWREDSSNSEEKYSRNYVRHTIIPQLEKLFPQVKTNIVDTTERMREAEILYRQALDLHKKALIEVRGAELFIPVLKLQKSVPLHTIIFELMKPYGFTAAQVGEVVKLFSAESGRQIFSASHRILRNRKWLVISPLVAEAQSTIIISEEDTTIKINAGTLEIKKVDAAICQISSEPSQAFLNASEVTFPLLLRRAKPGDYFYPFGLRKKKKIARFLIDQKLSAFDKEKVWVLQSSERIAWIVGMRIDDRFKLTSSTKNVIHISWSNL